ncbi:Vacuolar protein sorting-associated protein 33A [Mycena sanguinolenta]|uniref:Vacuolar protein sorting-associated protein 33A n=1 Tax=Mycena sanguinolenta TaxID=230812 RepID=A0A8H6XAW5_9AGAR|nr:Vacuolar protein sorting-associated protein 33A [Mycena sanguinolenta]
MATSTSDSHSETAPAEEPLLDVNLLKEIGKKALVDALNSVNGAKTLVLDASLAGPLGLVIEVSLLKHHGVDKMFWLEGGALTSTTTNIVYLCRPKIKHVKIIADQIKRHAKESQKHTYTLLLVPRISTLVSRILEEEGVLGDVRISSYNLQFIPIADDVISLENENAFKEIWVDGDETVIYDSAQALLTLEKMYGLFPRIIGKGDHAARLATLLTRHLPSDATAPDTLLTQSEKIDSLVVLDRRVDMITPLLTQLTYEGLIDELIGVKNSHVELPVSLLTPPAPAGAASTSTAAPESSQATSTLKRVEAKKKHHLTTSTDPLFAELRDLNFSSVGKRLNKVARRLEQDYQASQTGRHQAKTVAQLRDFVGKLGGLQTEHQSLRLHTGLSELLVPLTRTDLFNKTLEIQQNLLASYEFPAQITAIEDLVAQGADMQTVLRLLCLASITTGGVKAKNLENLKREILQAYGYNYLPLLLSLASPPLGILLPNPMPSTSPPVAKYPFVGLRKSFRLLIDDSPEALDEVENDISFVYSGYAPISIRLVQCVAQKGGVLSNPAEKEKAGAAAGAGADGKGQPAQIKAQAHPIAGWRGFEDIVATIPGETIDIAQNGQSGSSVVAAPMAALLRPLQKPTTTVVFFLGGCTYTEIAALRWVGRQNRGRNFLIATTGIINGNTIFESISSAPKAAATGPKDAAI